MKIIGWVRFGDKTACGGTVVEGDPTCISHGRAYAFQGAHIACRKGCVIVEGFSRTTLPNGRHKVLHGMMTSGGCPLYSTLNNVDGISNEDGSEIPIRFAQNEVGDWVGKMNEGYDQHFILTDEETGKPLVNRSYRLICNGSVVEGRTDAEGKTAKVTSDDPTEVTIEVMPEGYAGAAG